MGIFTDVDKSIGGHLDAGLATLELPAQTEPEHDRLSFTSSADAFNKAQRQAPGQCPILPRNTVTEAAGSVNFVAVLAFTAERAAGPSGSACPPFGVGCHWY